MMQNMSSNLAANHVIGSETPKPNAFDDIGNIFLNLDSTSNIFQETHYSLILTDSAMICIYLRRSQPKFFKETTDNRFPYQEKVRHQISKLLQ